MKFLSDILAKAGLVVDGVTQLNTVANATTDTDKFLVSDGGVVKYRTGAQMASDIGPGNLSVSTVKHLVKLGEAATKGQAVYVSSADGTNMIVSKASNATEATSSKTLGLLETGGVLNDQVYAVTEGLLAGLDTSTAVAGDPVWLGTGGNLIYGLLNKPYAPAHLVFIGIVTRVQQNNGEIFVKVQNGFELKEIHDVQITTTPADNTVLSYETSSSLYKMKSIPTLLGYTPASGTGVSGQVTYWTGTNAQAGSNNLFWDITNSRLGIGTASPTYKLHVVGITNADDGFVNGQATFHKSVSLGNIGAGVTYTLGQLNFGSVYTHHFTVRVSSYAGTKVFTFVGYQAGMSKLVSGTPYQQSRFDALDVIIESVTNVGGEITGVKIGIKNGSAGEDYIYSATIECLSSFGGWTALASNTVLTPYSAGTSNYVVAQAGSVGVGTTSPTSKLNIVNGAATPGVKIEHSASGHAALWATTNEYGFLLQGTSTSSTFYLASISSGSVSRFYVRADGNIGIGTDTPSAKLVVNGTTWINQTTDYGGAASKVQISAGSASDNVVIRTNSLYLYNYGNTYETLLRYGNGQETWNIGTTSGATPDFRLYEANGTAARLTIKAGGNVGIGTTNPITLLHINNAASHTFIYSTIAGASPIAIDNQSGNLAFWTASTRRMDITSTGNVGIGLTNPSAVLQVARDGGAATIRLLQLDNTNSTYSQNVYLEMNTSKDVLWGQGSAGGGTFWNAGTRGYGWSINGTRIVTYDVNGNVGVGTTSPASKLHVTGATDSNPTISIGTINANTGNAEIDFYSGTAGSNNSFTLRYTKTSSVDRIGFIDGGAIESFVIQNGGNVGIGTTSPSTKFHIVGTARVETGNVTLTQSYGITWNNGDNYIRGISGYHLQFTTYDGSASQVEVLRLTGGSAASGGGRVGIGTASPNRKLHVVSSDWDNTTGGGVIFENSNTVGSGLTLIPTASAVTNGTSGWAMYAGGPGAAIGDGNLGFWAHGTNAARLFIRRNGQIAFTAYTASSSFTGTAAGLLAFDSSGNLITLANNTYLTGNQTITLSGDATGSGATAITVTLANSGVAAATYGSASAVPVITVDAKGRVTNVTTASISGSLTFTGDVTGSGTTGTTTTLTLANSGVTAGTYNNVTVNAKGLVTSGSNVSYLTSYTETDTLATVTGRGASTSIRTTFVEVGVTRNGADTVADGPWFRWTNADTSRQMLTQLNASNGLTTWAYNGSTWSTAFILSQAGAGTFSSSVTATSFVRSGGTSSQFLKADGSVDSTTYQSTSQKGQANGYASLDGAGKVPIAQLPSSIMEYKGTWNASTNSPSLADGTGDTGDVYRVSTAGTRNLGSGSITFDVGDYVIYNGTIWEKSDTTDAVASVNGLTGVITLTTTNIGEGTNLYYTDARARAAITLTTTGTSGAATYSGGVLNIPQYQPAGSYLTAESDTLATVTARGATTSTQVILNGGIRMGNAYLNPSGDLNHFHFNGTAIIPNTTTTASNASMGTASYRWSNIYGGGFNISGTTGDVGYIATTFATAGTNGRILHLRDDKATVSVDSYVSVGWTSSPGQDVYIGKRTTSGAGFFAIQNSSATELFTINLSSGNFGIQVSNPTNKLQIGSVGSSGYGGNDLAIGNGTQVMAFYQSSTVSTWYTNTNFSLMPSGSGATGNLAVGATTASNRLTVSGSADITGNLGIGIANPAVRLDVNGSVYVRTGVLYLDTIAGYTSGVITLNSSTNLIIPSGRVGIGLTNPDAILDVSHTAGTTNIIRVSNGSGNYRWRVDQNFSMIMTNASGTDTFSVTTAGTLTAISLIKSGGTSSQFLKADGSVDSNSYLTAESDTLSTVTNRGNTTSQTLFVDQTTGGGYVFRTSSAWGGWARHGFSIADGSSNIMAAIGGYGGSGTSIAYMYIGKSYTDFSASFNPDGNVEFRYDNSTRLTVDSGGISVSGRTLSGWGQFSSSTQGTPIVKAIQEDTTSGYYLFQGVTGSTEMFRVDRSGGGYFAGSVGIGTTTLYGKLAVSSGNFNGIRIDTNAGYDALSIGGTGALAVDAPGITGGRFYVANSGKTGIGTNNPSKTLHVYTADNEGIYLQGTGGGVWMDIKSAAGKIWSYGAQNDGCGIYNRTDGVYRMFIADSGAVTFSSSVTCTSLTETSTIKIKENIAPVTAALDKVDQLQPVSYNKKGSTTKEIGLIAEDVFDVYPEFVLCDDNGEPVGIHYSRLTAVLIESVKELKNRIQQLEKRN